MGSSDLYEEWYGYRGKAPDYEYDLEAWMEQFLADEDRIPTKREIMGFKDAWEVENYPDYD